MPTHKFIEVLSKDNFGFLFDAKKLKDRFMSYASHLSSPHKSPVRHTLESVVTSRHRVEDYTVDH